MLGSRHSLFVGLPIIFSLLLFYLLLFKLELCYYRLLDVTETVSPSTSNIKLLTLSVGELFHKKCRTPSVGNKNIFFVETRCALVQKDCNMTARQACAIESAARAHSDRDIYLAYTCDSFGDVANLPLYVKKLLTFHNVFFFHVNMSDLTRDTVVEEWWGKKEMAKSWWPAEFSSDLARLLVLYKYGGVYLDLDFVVVRSLDGLDNFLALEGLEQFSNAALGFQSTGEGHITARKALNEFKSTFNGTMWGYNGPMLIQRIMKRICNTSEVRKMTSELCKNITITSFKVFYPIGGLKFMQYFQPDNMSFFDELDDVNSPTLAVHVWNSASGGIPVDVGSDQIYARLAERFCPNVNRNCGKTF